MCTKYIVLLTVILSLFSSMLFFPYNKSMLPARCGLECNVLWRRGFMESSEYLKMVTREKNPHGKYAIEEAAVVLLFLASSY